MATCSPALILIRISSPSVCLSVSSFTSPKFLMPGSWQALKSNERLRHNKSHQTSRSLIDHQPSTYQAQRGCRQKSGYYFSFTLLPRLRSLTSLRCHNAQVIPPTVHFTLHEPRQPGNHVMVLTWSRFGLTLALAPVQPRDQPLSYEPGLVHCATRAARRSVLTIGPPRVSTPCAPRLIDIDELDSFTRRSFVP